MTEALRARLESIVGRERVSTWTEPALVARDATAREVPLAAPADDGQAVELVRLAGADGLALVPLGLGTKAGACRAAARLDFALTTRELTGIEAYEPGDGTVTARAGTRMAELAERVGTGGHRLVPDVPAPAHATLGGTIAAGRSGVARLRFGPVRNHVLGVRALLADGTLAQSGGRLVKNVTGYDLHRLYCGSHGTLCVILAASLRLFPLPEQRVVLHARPRDFDAALDACKSAGNLALPFDAIAIDGRGNDWLATFALSGRRVALEAHLPALRDALAPYGSLAESMGESARAALEALRDREARGSGSGSTNPPAHFPRLDRPTESVVASAPALVHPTLCVACVPSRVAEAAEIVHAAAAELGAPPPHLLVHPGVATLSAWLAGDAADDLALELASLFERAGLACSWPGASAALRLELDPFGAPSAAGVAALARRLRDSLDPRGVFARGRFHGGL